MKNRKRFFNKDDKVWLYKAPFLYDGVVMSSTKYTVKIDIGCETMVCHKMDLFRRPKDRDYLVSVIMDDVSFMQELVMKLEQGKKNESNKESYYQEG